MAASALPIALMSLKEKILHLPEFRLTDHCESGAGGFDQIPVEPFIA